MIDDDLKEYLSATVQLARKRLGMTQEEQAAGIGRTPDSVSNIERGRQLPSLDTRVHAADLTPTAMFTVPRQYARTVEVTRDANIGESDRMLSCAIAPQHDALVRDHAVPLGTVEGLSECRGRRHGEIEQADLARIEVEREVKAQERVVQTHGRLVEEVNLAADGEPYLWIGDYFRVQAGDPE
jgi:DNA-binding XRE family transcriptional regulator